MGGRPMLEWSEIALRAAGIDRIVVAVPEGYERPDGVLGGQTRSESRNQTANR